MKKLLGCFFFVMLFVFGSAASLHALSIGLVTDLPYIGTNDGQDNLDPLNDVIDLWNTTYAPPETALPSAIEPFVEDETGGGPSETLYWSGNYDYLSAKYDSKFDVFYIAGLDGSVGVSFTGDGQHDLSHIRLWNPNPVPEPTTMLLFGAGLVGLTGFGRKKFKK